MLSLGYCALAAGLTSTVAIADLRETVPMSDTVTALHNSFFGWSLIALSVLPLTRWSRSTMMKIGALLIAIGATLFGSATHISMSLSGSLLYGLGAAAMVKTLPAIVADRFPETRTSMFAKLNAVPVAIGMAMPLLVTTASGANLSWRIPVLTLGPVIGIVCFGVLALHGSALNPTPSRPFTDAPIAEPRIGIIGLLRYRTVRARFILQTANVAVEFGVGSWTVVFLRDIGGASTGMAPIAAFAWGLGMLVGRLLTPRFRRLGARLEATTYAAVTISIVLFATSSHPWIIVATTALIAFFIAPVYALGIDRLFATSHQSQVFDDDSVGALGALASGIGITIAPTLVGAISDAAGLRWALLVPAAGAALYTAAALLRWRHEAGRLGLDH
jgi:predicted MFS family arabinose efflux permease